MEDNIKSWFNKLYRKSHALYILSLVVVGGVLFGATLAILVFTFCYYYTDYYKDQTALSVVAEIFVNLIATVVGVILAYFMYRFIFLVSHRDEDKNKVSYKNSDMWRQYGTEYRQQFELNGTVFTVYCEKLLHTGEFKKLFVEDDPDNYFSLDSFIKSQFFTLNEAHTMSTTANSVTVRLIDVIHQPGDDAAVIKTARSTYLSHLLTNRALDYELKSGVTIRSLFENTNHLVPLSRSRLSNHLGVNALVFINDKEGNKYLLLPERGNNATVAKHKVTASIATRLEMDKEHFPNTYIDKLTSEYVEKGCIKFAISKAIRVTNPPIDSIKFLGLSRDIYEGGKPTLFYTVNLNMTPEEYFEAKKTYENNKKIEDQNNKPPHGHLPLEEEKIDEVETIHVVKWSTLKLKGGPTHKEKEPKSYNPAYDKAELECTCVTNDKTLGKKGIYTIHKGFEQNLIANFWFYLGCEQ